MPKPVTPQEMFDLWQKMVNPGAYPLQSLMFPALDPKEVDKRIAELETVEHWLRANLTMLQLSIRSLEYQRAMLKGGEKAASAMRGDAGSGAEAPTNPGMWAWNMMAQAGKSMADAAQAARTAAPEKPKAARRRKRPASSR
jgi:hypothetical protein